jgi:hypothetical protein
VVLLGDSVFDNKAYVAGGPDVVAQLRARLPTGWRASLAAVDGAVTADVARQLGRVPHEATHLVVSVGGNDALRQEAVLGEPVRSVGEGLARLGAVADRFRQDYRAMLTGILAHRLPTALCTIYDPRFPDPQRRRLAIIGLALFNDVIAREAFSHGLTLIDRVSSAARTPTSPTLSSHRPRAAQRLRLPSPVSRPTSGIARLVLQCMAAVPGSQPHIMGRARPFGER